MNVALWLVLTNLCLALGKYMFEPSASSVLPRHLHSHWVLHYAARSPQSMSQVYPMVQANTEQTSEVWSAQLLPKHVDVHFTKMWGVIQMLQTTMSSHIQTWFTFKITTCWLEHIHTVEKNKWHQLAASRLHWHWLIEAPHTNPASTLPYFFRFII